MEVEIERMTFVRELAASGKGASNFVGCRSYMNPLLERRLPFSWLR